MFFHLVMFQFHDKSNAIDAKKKLEALVADIPELISVTVGIDELEGERSWDMILETRFASKVDYEVYATHPAHNVVLNWLKPKLKSAATIDYTAL